MSEEQVEKEEGAQTKQQVLGYSTEPGTEGGLSEWERALVLAGVF